MAKSKKARAKASQEAGEAAVKLIQSLSDDELFDKATADDFEGLFKKERETPPDRDGWMNPRWLRARLATEAHNRELIDDKEFSELMEKPN